MAVIGGSFVDVGGHNPIEAIKAHIPVISAPALDILPRRWPARQCQKPPCRCAPLTIRPKHCRPD
ncbi:MAG: hypothetical protein R2857_01665 [Vampirovibrionales bacterium]